VSSLTVLFAKASVWSYGERKVAVLGSSSINLKKVFDPIKALQGCEKTQKRW
jgi:hypothetical protein